MSSDPKSINPSTPHLVSIVPCHDLNAAEQWWNKLGFTRPADQGHDDYRMLANGESAEIHLRPLSADEKGDLKPEHNPFGVYLYTPEVDALAAKLRESIIEPEKCATHKEWGMYEFAVNGPDDLLVRVGWPSRLVRGEGESGDGSESEQTRTDAKTAESAAPRTAYMIRVLDKGKGELARAS